MRVRARTSGRGKERVYLNHSIVLGALMPHPPLLIPQIGKNEISQVKNSQKAMQAIAQQIVRLEPEVIVIISPHGPMFEDAITVMDGEVLRGNLADFGVSNTYQVKNDQALTQEIIRQAQTEGLPVFLVNEAVKKRFRVKQELDYAAILPLHYLQEAGYDERIVLLSPGFVSHETLLQAGISVRKAIEVLGRRAVIIASGDNSHALTADAPAGFHDEGHAFDQLLQQSIPDADWLALYTLEHSFLEKAAEDTLASMAILLGAFEQVKLNGQVFSYEGPFGVGYTVAAFEPASSQTASFLQELKQHRLGQLAHIRQHESAFVRLARQALETYVREGRKLEVPELLPEEMKKQAGCFVSIKQAGRLRGCIGTISPVHPSIAEEIIQNAIAAGTEDERFFPIEEEELENLTYSVDILLPEERVTELSQLDPKRYGLIVTNGHSSGLLLPNLEGVGTVEEQIAITKEKAGIAQEDQNVTMYRFEVVRYT